MQLNKLHIAVLSGLLCGIVFCNGSSTNTAHSRSTKPTTQDYTIQVPMSLPYPMWVVVTQDLPTEPTLSIPEQSVTTSNYASLIDHYDWPVQTMTSIMMAESGGDPNAISPPNYDGLRDYGLFQIHGAYVLDPVENVALAYSIYVRQGLNAWTTYTSGAYASY